MAIAQRLEGTHEPSRESGAAAQGARGALFAEAYGLTTAVQGKGPKHAEKQEIAKEAAAVKREAADVAHEKFSAKTEQEFQQLFQKLVHEKGATPKTVAIGLQERADAINKLEHQKGSPERVLMGNLYDINNQVSRFFYFITNGPHFNAQKEADAVRTGTNTGSVYNLGTVKGQLNYHPSM